MEAVYSPSSAVSLFDPVRRVYIFFGEDDRQKDEALSLLRSKAIDEAFADFDLEQLDADSADSEKILSAACLAPFASAARVVVVRRAEVYRKREMAAEADRLAAGVPSLGSSSCLVFRAGAAEDESSRGKTALHAKLDAAVKEAGAIVRFRPMGDDQLADWLMEEASRAGKTLTPDAAQLFTRTAGGNRTAIRIELEKAICYAGKSSFIGEKTVEAILSHDPEDVTFKLVDAIGRRNGERALYLLAELLRYDSKPHSVSGRLLALLARQFGLLWQARELDQRGIGAHNVRNLPPEIAAELPGEGSITAMAWKAGDLFSAARGWSRESLAEASELLSACDVSNKGGGEGSEDVVGNLKTTIARICALK